MKSGIIDKNGVEVKLGDTLAFPVVDDMGRLHKDMEDFRGEVIFKYGCFGIETEKRFVPLFSFMATVTSFDKNVVYLKKYPFWVVK